MWRLLGRMAWWKDGEEKSCWRFEWIQSIQTEPLKKACPLASGRKGGLVGGGSVGVVVVW